MLSANTVKLHGSCTFQMSELCQQLSMKKLLYLDSINCSWFQFPVALGRGVGDLALVPADDEVLHLDGVVVERIVGVHDLIGRPGGVLLDLPPAGEELVPLGVLGVVLAHDDAVPQHRPVLVAEVILPEPDRDRVHRPRDLGREHRPVIGGNRKY